MLFILDANVLIDANRDYYPIGQVPEFWDWLVHMGKHGRVRDPIEVYEKLTDSKNDSLADWLKRERDSLLLQAQVDGKLVAAVIEHGYANDLTDVEVEKLNEDPFLIAYALLDIAQRCVVTTEVSRPTATRANRRIPGVCDHFGVRHCNTFQLVRELMFSTNRGEWLGAS